MTQGQNNCFLYHHSSIALFLLNLCVVLSFKGFERDELAHTESSWFVWFKTEYELAKFERSLFQAWRQLFQVCSVTKNIITGRNETVMLSKFERKFLI